MSSHKVSVLVPPLRIVPPGAAWLAGATGWLFGPSDSRSPTLARWLETRRQRAASDRAERRVARDRSQLLALASRYSSSQPEFAKDLIAAARNERAG